MNTGITTCISTLLRSHAALPPRRAFTLIELLIVIGIIVALTSMFSVMLAMAQRTGKVANTRATMMKVDQAIRLFRTDMRIYPWQTDLGVAPAEPAQWGNNLAWRLAWKPPPPASSTAADPDRITYIRAFQDDIAAIHKKFRFVDGCNIPPAGSQTEGTHAFRIETQTTTSRINLLVSAGSLSQSLASLGQRWIPGTPVNGNDCTGDALALTQMAQEVTILAYTAGQMPTQAPTGIDPTLAADKALFPNEDERYPSMKISGSSSIPYRYFPYNKAGYYGDDSRGPVLTTTTAKAQGWRGEYLADEFNGDAANGRLEVDPSRTAILDAWGRQLVYVSVQRPGVRGYMPALTTSIMSGTREDRYNMGPQGRTVTALMASDIRTTAGASYVHEFELWSAGRDGLFAGSRDNPVNTDNVSLLPYTRGLK